MNVWFPVFVERGHAMIKLVDGWGIEILPTNEGQKNKRQH